ncbi:MAG: hypothetical protein LC667_05765 [Thioalkalivibrio sp.]|nr:hypothetical protein [Thioalkalivibrio sp.]
MQTFKPIALERERDLPDGSYLARARDRDARRTGHDELFRVIDYSLDEPGRPGQDRGPCSSRCDEVDVQARYGAAEVVTAARAVRELQVTGGWR